METPGRLKWLSIFRGFSNVSFGDALRALRMDPSFVGSLKREISGALLATGGVSKWGNPRKCSLWFPFQPTQHNGTLRKDAPMQLQIVSIYHVLHELPLVGQRVSTSVPGLPPLPPPPPFSSHGQNWMVRFHRCLQVDIRIVALPIGCILLRCAEYEAS